jgi:uncharacterized protein (DUF1015 family)
LADIRPFQGVHYNPSLTEDLAKVLSPPYDIITPQIQEELYQRSNVNFVRIEFGRELPKDKDNDNKYTRAAATVEKWLEQGVLEVDRAPSIYVHDHHFTHQAKPYRRRSINCLVRLEEWDRKVVRPHEGTLAKPKDDRLNLLWALHANTSPVMTLYEDQEGKVSSLLDVQTREQHLLNASIENGESHYLWALTDAKIIGEIRDVLADQPLYIADGHHRYESALAYRRERHSLSDSVSENEPYDYVMMTLVDFADPGLVILPAHRMVRGIAPSALDGLLAGIETCFAVKELPLQHSNIQQQVNDLLAAETNEVKTVLCGIKNERLLLLTLRDFNLVRTMIPYFHSELYQRLDVSIVDHVILEDLLGLTHDMAGAFIDYTSDVVDAVSQVLEQEYQLAFLVNPVKPEVIKGIADSGDRMPRKSTYFYPKLPAGLVFYRFD